MEISAAELDLIGEVLELNVQQPPFRFPVHGETLEDRERLATVVAESLIQKGLIDGGALVPEAERLTALFARGSLAIVMLGTSGKRSHCVRATLDGSGGVIAAQQGELIRFTSVTPGSVVRELVGRLPAMRPGPGRSATIVVADASSSRPNHRNEDEDFSARFYLEDARPARSNAELQRSMAERIARRPRSGTGYFTVTARDHLGRESDPLTLTWLDTDVGRYAIIPSTGADGRTFATYFPADLAVIDHELTKLVNRLL